MKSTMDQILKHYERETFSIEGGSDYVKYVPRNEPEEEAMSTRSRRAFLTMAFVAVVNLFGAGS